MYVCLYVQVQLSSPTRTVVALRHWPPWLEHQGGTAIGGMSRHCLVSSGAHTPSNIYIYICLSLRFSCRRVLSLLKSADFFVCAL